MGAEFLVQHLRYKTAYLSTPTWGERYITFDYIGGWSMLLSHVCAAVTTVTAKLFCQTYAEA